MHKVGGRGGVGAREGGRGGVGTRGRGNDTKITDQLTSEMTSNMTQFSSGYTLFSVLEN